MKAALKELSFQAGGHILHWLFWQNLAPAAKAVREPGGVLAEALKNEFGSFERFKKEFSSAADRHRGFGLGGARQVWLDRKAADHANREA